MKNEEQTQADKDAAEGRHYQAKPAPLAARLWRWAFVGVAGATILLSALLLSNFRPSPAPEANNPVGPAQPVASQPGGVQPGGSSAAQPSVEAQGPTIEACVAFAGDVKLEIVEEEREEIRAQMGGGPVQGYQRWVRWKQVYRSATQDPVVVIEHYARNAGGGVEPESGWDTGGVQTPTPSDVVQRDAWRGFKVSMYGAVDPAWDYVDRVAIMRDRPECVPLWKDETVLDRIAREVPVPAAPEPD
jgi:hypothetical protein